MRTTAAAGSAGAVGALASERPDDAPRVLSPGLAALLCSVRSALPPILGVARAGLVLCDPLRHEMFASEDDLAAVHGEVWAHG